MRAMTNPSNPPMTSSNDSTDELLLEEYSREIFGDLTPIEKLTVSELIESHRRLRDEKRKHDGTFRKAADEGYSYGYKLGVERAAADTIQFDDLRKMNIQDLANLIGTDDD